MNKRLSFFGGNRTPVIRQTEAAECGLACLAMVASFFGHHIDLPSIRQKFSISMKGTTLAHLIDIADQLKLNARPVKIELGALGMLSLPAILHWDLNHFVVLTKVVTNKITVHDPAHGQRRLSMAECSQHFTGIAIELSPMTGFQPKVEKQKITFSQLVGRLPGAARAILQIFLLAGVLEFFVIASPFYMQLVVDSAVVSEDEDLLTVLGLGFLLLALLQVGVSALRSWVVMVLGTTLNFKLLSNLFRHLLHLPMDFFAKRHLGDIVSRFESVNVIQRTLTTTFIEAVVDGLMAIATLVMMLVYSWRLAVIVLCAGIFYGILRLVLYRPFRQASEEQILCGAKQQTSFLETVRGVQSVKLFNRQLQRRALFENRIIDTFNANIRIQKLGILYKVLNGTLFGIENIAVIWLGAMQILGGGFSVGMLFAFIAYKQQFTNRIAAFIEKAIDFKMLELHMERVGDVALTEVEADEVDNYAGGAIASTTIEVRNLSYRYSDAEPPVLNNVNLVIKEGESVAIVGPSGCGKTTLLKVLLGLLSPTAGEVFIGQVNLARLTPSRYRDAIGAVMQDDQLFAGSIADNISFFDQEADLQWVQHCAELAAIHTDVITMPMGYNTLIGDMGTVLSGGQKQRILLARALYKRPKILFLDEATSHLDSACEQVVNIAIRRLEITRVLIAHRAETIESADRIIALDKGTTESVVINQNVTQTVQPIR